LLSSNIEICIFLVLNFFVSFDTFIIPYLYFICKGF